MRDADAELIGPIRIDYDPTDKTIVLVIPLPFEFQQKTGMKVLKIPMTGNMTSSLVRGLTKGLVKYEVRP